MGQDTGGHPLVSPRRTHPLTGLTGDEYANEADVKRVAEEVARRPVRAPAQDRGTLSRVLSAIGFGAAAGVVWTGLTLLWGAAGWKTATETAQASAAADVAALKASEARSEERALRVERDVGILSGKVDALGVSVAEVLRLQRDLTDALTSGGGRGRRR